MNLIYCIQGEILRVLGGTKNEAGIRLEGHTSFVQGVAWDPMNQVVVTQSADRTCRTYQVRSFFILYLHCTLFVSVCVAI